MASTVCLHGLQKKTPLHLGIAQITPPAARSLGNFFTFVFAPKIKSVETNLCRGAPSPPAGYWSIFFTLESVKINSDCGFPPKLTMPKGKVVFLDSFPYTPLNRMQNISGISQPVWNGFIDMLTPGLCFQSEPKKKLLAEPKLYPASSDRLWCKAVWEKTLTFKLACLFTQPSAQKVSNFYSISNFSHLTKILPKKS